jgi:hypothetical protein
MRLPKGLLALAGVAAAALSCGEDARARGDRLAREHRWTEAVDAYKKAIEAYPHDYDAAWGIARIYCGEVHMPDKCLAWTAKLLEAYPERAEYRRAAAQGWRDRAEEARGRGDEAAVKAAELEASALEK